MPNQFDNLSDEDLVLTIVAEEAEAAAIKKRIFQAKNELIDRRRSEIAAALAEKEEPFGSTSTQIGAKKAKFNTPKEVTWDQKGLAELHAQLSSDPEENVDDYIEVEYHVKETAYKNWPTNIRSCFEQYRSVKPGNVSVKIEDIEEK